MNTNFVGSSYMLSGILPSNVSWEEVTVEKCFGGSSKRGIGETSSHPPSFNLLIPSRMHKKFLGTHLFAKAASSLFSILLAHPIGDLEV